MSDLLLNAFLGFSADPGWLKDRTRAKGMIAALLGSPVFAGIAIARTGDGDFAPVTPAKAAKLVATGGELSARFHDREDNYELWIELDLRAARGEVRINVSGGALAQRGDRALDELIGAMRGCVAALRGVAGLKYGSIRADVVGGFFEFARPRPPRPSQRYPEGSIVTFIDPELHASGASFAKPEEIAALTRPPPPAPATTSTSDGLLTVRWAASCDEVALRDGASAHAQWIADRIAPDIDDEFNELGDQREDRRGTSKARGKLTFYDPESEVGYKAVLVFPDGKFERSAWNDAKKIAKAGKLPDGTPVSAVRIVVPLRDLAFAVADDARAAGFDAVLYPDDEGNLWNPDPPGEWRAPPVRSSGPA